MTSLRKTIAKRLVEVKNQAAMVTIFNEGDMQKVANLRKAIEEEESLEEPSVEIIEFLNNFFG